MALMNKVGPMEPLESNGEVKVQKLGEPVLCLANSAIYSNKEVLEFLLVHRSIKLGKPAKKVFSFPTDKVTVICLHSGPF